MTGMARRTGCALTVLVSCVVSAGGAEPGERTSRISDEVVPQIDPDAVPQRPRPFLELGNPFLGSGALRPGFRVPGGAVWQPSFLVFGTLRTAFQAFNSGDSTVGEWATRLDLFGNYQLSGTERLLIGFRPLDEDGEFSGYRWQGGPRRAESRFDAVVETFFFEGDFGELFPDADRRDFKSVDWGFSVGRQPLFYQEGMLINDSIDSFGVTRNTILPRHGSDLQITFLYGVNDIHRDDNLEGSGAQMFGTFLAGDFPVSTFNADFVYVFDTKDDTDGLYWGLSSVQRLGHASTSFRVLGSHALGRETEAVSDGYLLFGEASWTPPWTHDLVYVNVFLGIDRFSSAARGPSVGGPLGRTGILFAAMGLGQYGAPLGNRADESFGAAVGYQLFSHDTRRQFLFEVGGRGGSAAASDDFALGARVQQAYGRHFVLQLDGFRSFLQSRDDGWGARMEMRVLF